MAEISGVVQEIKARPVAGGKVAYGVFVGGQEYGAGLYAPKCAVGDYVKFELDEARGYKNIGRGTLKVSKNKPPAEAVAAAAATAPVKNSQGGSVDTRQDTISRQAAMNTAISFMTLLHAADALGLPAATAKKGSRQEAMEAMLAKYTQEFYEGNTGVKWKDIAPSAPKGSSDDAEAEDEAAPADTEWE